MQSTDRQGYDRGTSLFSPDGRVYQVEYAREAVKRGSPSVGIRASDGVVLAAQRRVRSPLVEARSIEKLHKVDDHLGIASAGHVSDARQLVDVGRRAAQVERLRYGQPITTGELTNEISEHIQEYTQTGGTRPFGAALLIGGYVDEPHLFETDPSGTFYEWKATAIGGRSADIRSRLEEQYASDIDLQDAIALAVDVVADEDENGTDRDEAATLALAVVDEDGYRQFDEDHVAEYV